MYVHEICVYSRLACTEDNRKGRLLFRDSRCAEVEVCDLYALCVDDARPAVNSSRTSTPSWERSNLVAWTTVAPLIPLGSKLGGDWPPTPLRIEGEYCYAIWHQQLYSKPRDMGARKYPMLPAQRTRLQASLFSGHY